MKGKGEQDTGTLATTLILTKLCERCSKRTEQKPVAGNGEAFTEGQVQAAQETIKRL